MSASNLSRHASRPIHPEATTHLYTVGQAVRLRGGFTQWSHAADIYRVTGILPPRGEFPQYRIRNDNERHERVATQDHLEPASSSPADDGATLIERTFGCG
jgi:hypothetical protein